MVRSWPHFLITSLLSGQAFLCPLLAFQLLMLTCLDSRLKETRKVAVAWKAASRWDNSALRATSQTTMAPSQFDLYGIPTQLGSEPLSFFCLWWAMVRGSAPSPISGLLASVLTPGPGGLTTSGRSRKPQTHRKSASLMKSPLNCLHDFYAYAFLQFIQLKPLTGAFFQFVQGNLSLYITHSLKLSNYMIPGIMTLLATAIALLPVAQFLISRIGKKWTLAVGMLNMFPILLVSALLPIHPPLWAFFPVMAWAGFTIAIGFLLPW
ncbi:unnamed protein product [Schistocephalus solidus]|uniref:ABC transmembrane type-1 domain-containing protein n=1 Tax=Schistocephalus solidus TaxID=70667 RepID=A0A183SS79_SCHSO|nr:unnamed protein product [Schistocephalus solidus]